MKDILHSIFPYFTDNKTSKVIVCRTENASCLSGDKLQHVERNFWGVRGKTSGETLKKQYALALNLLFYPSNERIHLRALKESFN